MFARLQALGTGALVATLSVACADGDEPSQASAAAQETSTLRPRPDFTEELADDPVAAVLRSLGQTHAQIRGRLGPHQLQYDSTFSMQPKPAGEELPPVESEVAESFEIKDSLTLLWLSEDEHGPRFSLQQHNNASRGRDVVADAGRLYTKLEHRPWQDAPIESEVYELWLDDAWRGPGDVLQLAGPWLAVTATPKPQAGLDGGDAIVLSLSVADQRNDALAVNGWRGSATLDEISGEVVVDARTGAWLTADLAVRYAVPAADGRKARGSVTLRGGLQPAPQGAAISVPLAAQPVFERARYDVERAQLLDGLAAP